MGKHLANHKIKGDIFMYFHKAFDSMSLDLLIHKTEIYGFSKNFDISVPLQVFDCIPLDLPAHKTEVYGFSKDSNIFVFLLRALEATS